MDLKELSQFDVRNIDFFDIQRRLTQRVEYLLYAGVGVVTLIIMLNVFFTNKVKVNLLQTEINTLVEKDEYIADYEDSKEALDNFINSLPQGSTEIDNIMNILHETAVMRNVAITSFNPKGEKNSDIYDMVMLEIGVSASNYSNLVLFMEDIENSDSNLRIEKWNVGVQTFNNYRSQSNLLMADVSDLETKVNASMEIDSISFKK